MEGSDFFWRDWMWLEMSQYRPTINERDKPAELSCEFKISRHKILSETEKDHVAAIPKRQKFGLCKPQRFLDCHIFSSFRTSTMKIIIAILALVVLASSSQAESLRRRRRAVVVERSLIDQEAAADFEFLVEETDRFLQTFMSLDDEEETDDDIRGPIIEEKCSVTASERSRDILSILTPTAESMDLLLIANTVQFKARMFVDQTDPAILCATDADRILQRYRAAILYYSLGGSSWTTSTGWMSASNECEWFGLECDGYSTSRSDSYVPITAIRLDENGLAGDLPSEIFGLPALQRLIMEGNGVSGSIPEAIAQATQLATLDLDFNSISGPLPASLYDLPSITNIDLNNNNLSGSISARISNLKTLNVLNLEDNNLTGEIPILSLLQLQELGKFYIYVVVILWND